MKYLLLIVIVLVVLWFARAGRRQAPPAARGPAAEPAQQPMLACVHCGLHLPRDEALPGRGGVFCGEPHRAEYEKAHPAP
ncbi:MAG TPA: PP0621 family protein [Albitalea sp.]|jgi:uncharacterized protein|nr:PP0621 family protein [Albitalea sp.]